MTFKTYLNSIHHICSQWYDGLITEEEAMSSIMAQMYMMQMDLMGEHGGG